MQPFVTEFPPTRAGVGDVLPAIIPPHTVALLPHEIAELFLRFCLFHDLVDDIHQRELVALSLPGGAEFPVR